MNSPRVSVVMVSWMTGPRLMDALDAVLGDPTLHELVLVNHANPAETMATLRDLSRREGRMILVESGGNLGFSKGCNLGALAATGDHLFFLNPDTVLQPGTLESMTTAAAAATARPWIIGARLVNSDGSEQRGGRRGELTFWTALTSFLGLERILPGLRGMHWEAEDVPTLRLPVPVVSGAAMMMRRDDYLALGGFDERYFLHVEDIDLCRSVRAAGGEVWFEPNAEVLHYGGTSRSSPLRVETHKANGLVKYFWKFSCNPFERLLTLMLAVPIYAAVWGRVGWLLVRDRMLGLLRRWRALARLARMRRR